MKKAIYFNAVNQETMGFEVDENASLKEIEEQLSNAVFSNPNLKQQLFPKGIPEHPKLLFINSFTGGLIRSEEFNLALDDNSVGKVEHWPFKVICIEDQPKVNTQADMLDLSKVYRVFFSNNPNRFLPPLDQTSLNVAAELNPNHQHHLIVDTSILTPIAKEALKSWSDKNHHEIIDIANIKVDSEIDALILGLVKLELKYWRDTSPSLGNVGIAADLVRLLFINKGIYLDCDVFMYEGFPLNISCSQGAFANYLFNYSYDYLNNDILAFGSEKGATMLNQFKNQALQNYFQGIVPENEALALEKAQELIAERSTAISALNSCGITKIDSVPDKEARKKYPTSMYLLTPEGFCYLDKQYNNLETIWTWEHNQKEIQELISFISDRNEGSVLTKDELDYIAKKTKHDHLKKTYGNFFGHLVPHLAGPWAWQSFLDEHVPGFTHKRREVVDCLMDLKSNANRNFGFKSCSWLSNTPEGQNEMQNSEEFTKFLHDLNEKGKSKASVEEKSQVIPALSQKYI